VAAPLFFDVAAARRQRRRQGIGAIASPGAGVGLAAVIGQRKASAWLSATTVHWRRFAANCVQQQRTKQARAHFIKFVTDQNLRYHLNRSSRIVEPFSQTSCSPTSVKVCVPNQPVRPRRGRFRTLPQHLKCGILERAAVLASCQHHNYNSKCWGPVIWSCVHCSQLIPNSRSRANSAHRRSVDIFVSLRRWLPNCTALLGCAEPYPLRGYAVPLVQACALQMAGWGAAPP